MSTCIRLRSRMVKGGQRTDELKARQFGLHHQWLCSRRLQHRRGCLFPASTSLDFVFDAAFSTIQRPCISHEHLRQVLSTISFVPECSSASQSPNPHLLPKSFASSHRGSPSHPGRPFALPLIKVEIAAAALAILLSRRTRICSRHLRSPRAPSLLAHHASPHPPGALPNRQLSSARLAP